MTTNQENRFEKIVSEKIEWARQRLSSGTSKTLSGDVGSGDWARQMKQHVEGYQVPALVEVEVELGRFEKDLFHQVRGNAEGMKALRRLQEFKCDLQEENQ